MTHASVALADEARVGTSGVRVAGSLPALRARYLPNDQDAASMEQEYAQSVEKWRKAGAEIVGGCCGIGPAHIARLREISSEDASGRRRALGNAARSASRARVPTASA